MNFTLNNPKKKALSSEEAKKTTVGLYLLDRLQELGVQDIFGVPGDYVLRFNKLIEEHSIRYVNATRENTAGYMADAYARLRGIGAVCITYGVGINIANAAAQAYVESSPLVIISGAAGTKEFEKCHALHHLINKSCTKRRDATQLAIFEQLTAAQAVLKNPETAAKEIDRVLAVCLEESRPVYIEIPRDIVDLPIPQQRPHPPAPKKSDAETLQEAVAESAALLQKCKRPVIWAGHEIQRFHLRRELLAFAEKFRIPIASTLLGKTVISERHPLFIGLYQGAMSRDRVQEYVESADCLLLLGAMLNDVDTGFFTAKLDEGKCIAASSDGVAIRRHRFENVRFPDYMRALASLESNIRFRNSFPANLDFPQEKPRAEPKKKMTTERLARFIEKHLHPDQILVSDFGDCLFSSCNFTLEEDSFFSSAYFSTLGFGIPAAVGAALAQPKKRVLALVGDGAFQMTCSELSTAVRYRLDPIIIVFNNRGYATERPIIEGEFNDIVNWNYSKLPELLGGGVGLKTATEEAFEAALQNALETRGEPTVIEVELEKRDFSPELKKFLKLFSKSSR